MPLYGKIVIIKRNGQDGTTFPLMARLCLFGRDPACDIRVQLANISKKHCAIVVGEDGKVSVNAYNRTLMNGREVKGRADISHKDIMTIADRSFRFEYPPGSIFKVMSGTPDKPTSSYLLGPSLETPKDETPPKPPASAGHTPRPKVIADSAKRMSTGASPKLKLPQNVQHARKSPSPKSNKSPTASVAKKRKIIKSPQSPSVQRKSQRKNVSFGPYLSPEQFDLNMPVNTPVKKGGTTPRRVTEPPKYFGSPMVYSANKGGKTSRKQSFTVTTIVEEEPAKSPGARRKTMSPKAKTPSPKSPRIPSKIKTLSPKSKTPSPKRKSLIGRISLPRKVSPRISESPESSDKLYLSSSDSSVADTPMKNLSRSSRESDRMNTTPSQSLKSPKPLPKIPTPKSPDSKKIKALAAIHASKLKSKTPKKTPRLATSSLKKGLNKKMFSEILKNGLAKKTPKVAKKLLKVAVGRKKNEVKKTPGRGAARSLKVKTPRHVNSPETIVIKKKKLSVSGGKKKSLSISSFPTPSNITTDVFVSPLDAVTASTSKRGRNKGAMISRFIEDQAKKNKMKGKSRKSGLGYEDPSGIKRLVKTPAKIVRKSESGYDNPSGIKRLVKTPPKSSPKPDYTHVSGLKRLFKSSPSSFDHNDPYGVEELMPQTTPGRSLQRSSRVNTVLYRSLGSPKPSTSNDIKELLESSRRSLNEDEIAKLFGSPTSKPSTPKSNSPPKLYEGSSNRRKSGRVSDTFVRPIGIATQIRNSPAQNLKQSPSTPKGRAKSITPKPNSVSPKNSTGRLRSISAKRRTATRGLLEEIVTQVEDNISPRRNTRNSATVSTPKNPKKSPSPKKRTPSQRKSFTSPSTSGAIPLTDSNAIPLPNISRIPISPLSNGNSVIITQNSDPHDILEKARVQDAGKLVVLYLVSPETISSVVHVPSFLSPTRGSGARASPAPVKTQSPTPTRGRLRRGVNPSPAKALSPKASPINKRGRRGRIVVSKETTSTPIQQFESKKTPSISPVAKDRSHGVSPARKRTVIEESPKTTRSRETRANKTKSPSPSKSQRAIENDLSSIKKSPTPAKKTKGRQTRGRKVDVFEIDDETESISIASPKAKSPSPLKRVTRGRIQKHEASLHKSKSEIQSPAKKATRGGTRVKKDISINASVASTFAEEAPTSPSPVKQTRAKRATPVKKTTRRGKANDTTDRDIDESNSLKSPSPVKKSRGKAKASPRAKPATPAKKITLRGKAKDTTDEDILLINSPKSPSPVKKTRGKTTTLPKPKAPASNKKVGRGKRKASPSPSPRKSLDETSKSPSPIEKPTRGGSGKKATVSPSKASTLRKSKRGAVDVGIPYTSKSRSLSPAKNLRGKRVAEDVSKSPKRSKTINYDEENVSSESEEDVIKRLKKETKPAKKTIKKAAGKKATSKMKTKPTKKAVKKKTGLSPVREEKDSDTSQDEPVKKSTPSPKARRTRRTRK